MSLGLIHFQTWLVTMFHDSSTALLVLSFATIIRPAKSSSSAVPKTKNYIDTIPGYNELSTCAVSVLSTIVRDENSGCQDTYALTSYTCFCTDSSSFFSNLISRDVVAGCNSSIAATQATSALGVFDAYCALGVAAGLVTNQVGESGGIPSRTRLSRQYMNFISLCCYHQRSNAGSLLMSWIHISSY